MIISMAITADKLDLIVPKAGGGMKYMGNYRGKRVEIRK